MVSNTRRVKRLLAELRECVAEMERDEAALLAGRSLVNLCQCSRVRVLVKGRDREVGPLTGVGSPG